MDVFGGRLRYRGSNVGCVLRFRRSEAFARVPLLMGAGFTLTFGVFQSYYEQHERFIRNKNIAVIGTVMIVCLLSTSDMVHRRYKFND
jgi:hypothetical protein